MTIKPGGACVTVAEALNVLDALANPLTDETVLRVADADHIERIIRERVEKLGLRLDTETPCFAPGPSTIDGYGIWPVRDYCEAVEAKRRPALKTSPRATEPPRTGWPKAGECEPVSHADPYQYGRYEKPLHW